VGTDTTDYISSLLQETLALRGMCKTSIQVLGKKNSWVPDLVGNLLTACNGIQEKAFGLKHIMSADGVHFTKHGYEKLAESLVKCCKTLPLFQLVRPDRDRRPSTGADSPLL
jgi:hypothetical protein